MLGRGKKNYQSFAGFGRLAFPLMICLVPAHACESASSQNKQVFEPQACDEICNVSREEMRASLEKELRAKLVEEIREELRAQLLEELQATVHKPEQSEETKPAEEIAENKNSENAPKYKVLPPSQEIEKDGRGLKILRQALSTQIERRLPVDERDFFYTSDGAIFCFIEVASVYDSERLLTLRWTHSSGISQTYELPIGQSMAWRTWSKLNLTRSMRGSWRCEVFNEDGLLLAYHSFYVDSAQ